MTNVLLSCGTDNSLILWDLRTTKAIFKILGHPEPITSIDISFDNTLITSSSHDGYVRLWDMLKATCLKTMVAESGSNSGVGICRMTPNSRYLLFGNLNSRMGLYNYQNDLLKQYLGHKNQEYCLEAKFVKDPRSQRMMVVSGSEDGRICAWDMNTQEMVIDSMVEGKDSNVKLVSTIDYDERMQTFAACGNFKGVYLNKLSNL